MNLLKLTPHCLNNYRLTTLHSLLSSPKTPNSSLFHHAISLSTSSFSISVSNFNFQNHRTNVSKSEGSMWGSEVESIDLLRDYEDLATDGPVYKKTLRLVECSMFAAVSGLAYFLSNSLSIENYFGCFFAFPIVISSMRWGLAAGRKTMVATAMLLFILSGPVKASTYLLMHGLVGLSMGSLWRLGANWGLSIAMCTAVLPVSKTRVLRPFSVTFYNCIIYAFLMSVDLIHAGSSNGRSRVCPNIIVPNKRKYTCSDHHKHPCFPHLFAHGHRCKYSSIDEYNLYNIWHTAFSQLWILCILATHTLRCNFIEARDEGFFDTAEMAQESNLMVNWLSVGTAVLKCSRPSICSF